MCENEHQFPEAHDSAKLLLNGLREWFIHPANKLLDKSDSQVYVKYPRRKLDPVGSKTGTD